MLDISIVAVMELALENDDESIFQSNHEKSVRVGLCVELNTPSIHSPPTAQDASRAYLESLVCVPLPSGLALTLTDDWLCSVKKDASHPI
jgi:hypothetical protein